jgi:hypothetical protein
MQETCNLLAGNQRSHYKDNNIDRVESEHSPLTFPEDHLAKSDEDDARQRHADDQTGHDLPYRSGESGGAAEEQDDGHDRLGRIAVAVADRIDSGLREAHGDRLHPGQRSAYEQQVRELHPTLADLTPKQQRALWTDVTDHVVERWPRFKGMPLEVALDDLLAAYDATPNMLCGAARDVQRTHRYNPETGRVEEIEEVPEEVSWQRAMLRRRKPGSRRSAGGQESQLSGPSVGVKKTRWNPETGRPEEVDEL